MIDWSRIDELRSEIGDDALAEVAQMFLDEAESVLARMTAHQGAAVTQEDCHFLKGAALNLGFEKLAKLCQSGEVLAAAGQRPQNLAEIQSCFGESRAIFQKWIAAAAA